MLTILSKGLLFAYLALSFAVIFQDVASGGMSASFTGQILMEAWEVISRALAFVDTSLDGSSP